MRDETLGGDEARERERERERKRSEREGERERKRQRVSERDRESERKGNEKKGFESEKIYRKLIENISNKICLCYSFHKQVYEMLTNIISYRNVV